MTDRPFLDKANQPTEQAIQTALGSMYTGYREIMELAYSYAQDWTFTKSSGWMMKLSDRKKALLYLIPLHEGFKISLTIREHERETFLQDDELASLWDQLAAAKKYPEGFALQFEIFDPTEFQRLVLFVGKIIAIRG